MYTVYSLIDPRGKRLTRYVGLTEDFDRRFLQHVQCFEGHRTKDKWIRDLLLASLVPLRKALATVPSLEEARKLEAEWIHHYLYRGMPLLNVQIPLPVINGRKLETWRYLDAVSRISKFTGIAELYVETGFKVLSDRQRKQPFVYDRFGYYEARAYDFLIESIDASQQNAFAFLISNSLALELFLYDVPKPSSYEYSPWFPNKDVIFNPKQLYEALV